MDEKEAFLTDNSLGKEVVQSLATRRSLVCQTDSARKEGKRKWGGKEESHDKEAACI